MAIFPSKEEKKKKKGESVSIGGGCSPSIIIIRTQSTGAQRADWRIYVKSIEHITQK